MCEEFILVPRVSGMALKDEGKMNLRPQGVSLEDVRGAVNFWLEVIESNGFVNRARDFAGAAGMAQRL